MSDQKTLPSLNPLIKIYPSTPRHDGQPQWTLYHPVSNQYFKIGWAEFECLSRFHRHKTQDDLIKTINEETALELSEEDVGQLIQFLAMNGLLDGKLQQNMGTDNKSWWNKMLHGYLYFTFPLLNPDHFLQKTLPIIRPLLSRQFHWFMMVLLIIGVVMTLPRWDEFTSSFIHIFTIEGAILTAFILMIIKIIHEFAHGYVAKMNGVAVPHMGVAFIILYPILYTEATGAWRLTNRKSRMQIGLAGVRFEVYLAAIALVLWHFMAPGLGQIMCFTVVMISLLGSLLINLNPLMRFDGYYVLSDYLDIENLHAVAISYARHSMRSIFLGLRDEPPHDYKPTMAFRLTAFGYAVIIYRFFLFLGIAVLVYAVFMKPLGLLAMILELAWFIGLPVYNELKIWWERRMEFISNRRFLITSLFFMGIILWSSVPLQTSYHFPAVAHARNYQVVYPPAPSIIETIHVQQGQLVKKGDVLISLSSIELEREIKATEVALSAMQNAKRRDQTNIDLYRERRGGVDIEIETLRKELENLNQKKDDLVINAKFDGVISDLKNGLREGQGIQPNDVVMRLIKPDDMVITAYVRDTQINQIEIGDKAVFRPAYKLLGGYDVQVESVEKLSVETIEFEILTSVYGGEIPTQQTDDGRLKPLNAVYKIKLKLMNDSQYNNLVTSGHVAYQGESHSVIWDRIPRWLSVARNELSLN